MRTAHRSQFLCCTAAQASAYVDVRVNPYVDTVGAMASAVWLGGQAAALSLSYAMCGWRLMFMRGARPSNSGPSCKKRSHRAFHADAARLQRQVVGLSFRVLVFHMTHLRVLRSDTASRGMYEAATHCLRLDVDLPRARMRRYLGYSRASYATAAALARWLHQSGPSRKRCSVATFPTKLQRKKSLPFISCCLGKEFFP